MLPSEPIPLAPDLFQSYHTPGSAGVSPALARDVRLGRCSGSRPEGREERARHPRSQAKRRSNFLAMTQSQRGPAPKLFLLLAEPPFPPSVAKRITRGLRGA